MSQRRSRPAAATRATAGHSSGEAASLLIIDALPPAMSAVSSLTVQSVPTCAMQCPSRRTAIRSLIRDTSSSSAEMNTTPMPSAARSATSFWICAFAPTSMPLVGSSRMNSCGSVISHRASSTFCWLPPLRFFTNASGSPGPDVEGVHVAAAPGRPWSSSTAGARSRGGPAGPAPGCRARSARR